MSFIVLLRLVTVFLFSSCFILCPKLSWSEGFFPISGSLLIGVPHPISLAADVKFENQWSVGGGFGSIRLPIKSRSSGETLTLGITNGELRGRWHPQGGVFFLGTILGIQSFTGLIKSTFSVAGSSVVTHVHLKVITPYFTPHFGWFWIYSSGFTLGVEVGWQFPLSSKSELTVAPEDSSHNVLLTLLKQTSQYKRIENDVEYAGNLFGKDSFPYITLLRAGWTF